MYIFKFVSHFITSIVITVVSYYGTNEILKCSLDINTWDTYNTIFVKHFYKCSNTFSGHCIDLLDCDNDFLDWEMRIGKTGYTLFYL